MTKTEFITNLNNLNTTIVLPQKQKNNIVAKDKTKAWCITCGTDDYAWGCIRAAQRLDWLDTKYDIIVVGPPTLNNDTKKLFLDNNINFKIIEDLRLFKTRDSIKEIEIKAGDVGLICSRAHSTFYNLILPLALTEYSLLFVFDGDKFFTENIDWVFDCIISDSVIFSLDNTNNSLVASNNNLTYAPYLGEYFCKPNIDLFNILLDRSLNSHSIFEEAFLGSYFNEQDSTENLYELIDYGNNILVKKQYHFKGAIKPWQFKYNKGLYRYFTKASYEEFNTFMDAYPEALAFYCLIFQSFNYSSDKENYIDCLLEFYDKSNNDSCWGSNIFKMVELRKKVLGI